MTLFLHNAGVEFMTLKLSLSYWSWMRHRH